MDRRVRQGQDVVVTVTKNPAIGIGWLKEARQKISAIDLDVLIHLDLTLNPMSHRVAMSRLAPVQACSGHTMSSGIDRKVISYYISWGAAEGTRQARRATLSSETAPQSAVAYPSVFRSFRSVESCRSTASLARPRTGRSCP